MTSTILSKTKRLASEQVQNCNVVNLKYYQGALE